MAAKRHESPAFKRFIRIKAKRLFLHNPA